MPDRVDLTSPEDTVAIALGTWIHAEPGPDYGTESLEQRLISQNLMRPGGVLALRSYGVRQMSFPLTIPSGPLGFSLTQWESRLRRAAQNGAVLDVRPEGGSYLMRFDIIDGRWEPDYEVRVNRAGRRRGTLYLDTQPFGYFPTWITVASAAQADMPLRATWVASLGDAPIMSARLTVIPTLIAMGSGPNGTWIPDLLTWGISGQAGAGIDSPSGLVRVLMPSAMTHSGVGSVGSQSFASQVSPNELTQIFGPGGNGGQFFELAFARAMGPPPGRYRAYVWAKLSPSTVVPGMLGMYVRNFTWFGVPSQMNTATVMPANASGGSQPWYGASPAYQFLDMGELTWVSQANTDDIRDDEIRLAFRPGSWNGTTVIRVAGMYLHPISGANGILNYGLGYPTVASSGAVQIDGQFRAWSGSGGAAYIEQYNAAAHNVRRHAAAGGYLGGLPYIRPSDNTLSLNIEARRTGTNVATPAVRAGIIKADYSLEYRPTFLFVRDP